MVFYVSNAFVVIIGIMDLYHRCKKRSQSIARVYVAPSTEEENPIIEDREEDRTLQLHQALNAQDTQDQEAQASGEQNEHANRIGDDRETAEVYRDHSVAREPAYLRA